MLISDFKTASQNQPTEAEIGVMLLLTVPCETLKERT